MGYDANIPGPVNIFDHSRRLRLLRIQGSMMLECALTSDDVACPLKIATYQADAE